MPEFARLFRDTLLTHPALLQEIRRGVEKESLRVNADSAMLSQARHPEALGSALTHPSITTDYSEALLEFITPVSSSLSETESQLLALHQFTAQRLKGELLWNTSMPCVVTGDSGIPIAEFGTSNVGQMKRIYRNGLGVRYGRRMQAIAGIHYNFSLPDSFWRAALRASAKEIPLAAFQTEGYLGLIRNFFSRVWLLVYLLGASPAVCASFLQGNRDHALQPLGDEAHTYHLPYATSLRMGDLGYTSNAQASIEVCYNSLDQYVAALRNAILTPHDAYRDFKLTDTGEQAQLNDSLLQIENEYYSPIRPKRVTRSGEAPVVALERAGIEYVEVRCVDINPFMPVGIDADTMRLLDVFLIACLVDDSPLCEETTLQRHKTNLQRVVNRGREPNLTLLSQAGAETPMRELAQSILDRMEEAAAWFDQGAEESTYQQVVSRARACVEDPGLTPSARLLAEIQTSGGSFWNAALQHSQHWHNQHLAHKLDPTIEQAMEAEAKESLLRQRELETHDALPFADYLADFYAQYRT